MDRISYGLLIATPLICVIVLVLSSWFVFQTMTSWSRNDSFLPTWMRSNRSLRRSLAPFMQEYRERLMKLAYYRGWQKSDAEDLSQDTICRAWEDRRFLRLRSELERRRWLRRQARTWSSRGSRQTLTSHEFNFANSVLAPEVHFEENSTKFSQAYLMERIQQAIPDQRNREIFILHVIEGMQQNEIAEFYHLSPGRISQIIAIVIAKLRRDQGLRELWYDD